MALADRNRKKMLPSGKIGHDEYVYDIGDPNYYGRQMNIHQQGNLNRQYGEFNGRQVNQQQPSNAWNPPFAIDTPAVRNNNNSPISPRRQPLSYDNLPAAGGPSNNAELGPAYRGVKSPRGRGINPITGEPTSYPTSPMANNGGRPQQPQQQPQQQQQQPQQPWPSGYTNNNDPGSSPPHNNYNLPPIQFGGRTPAPVAAVPSRAPLPLPSDLPGPLPQVYRPKPPLVFHSTPITFGAPVVSSSPPDVYLTPRQYLQPGPVVYHSPPPQQQQPIEVDLDAPILRPYSSPAVNYHLPPIVNRGGGGGAATPRGQSAPSQAHRRPSVLGDDGGDDGQREKMEARRRAQELQEDNARQMEEQRLRRARERERQIALERAEEARLEREREEVRRRELLDVARERYQRELRDAGPQAASTLAAERAYQELKGERVNPTSSPARDTAVNASSGSVSPQPQPQPLSSSQNSAVAPAPVVTQPQPTTIQFMTPPQPQQQPQPLVPMINLQKPRTASIYDVHASGAGFSYEADALKNELRQIAADQRRIEMLLEAQLRSGGGGGGYLPYTNGGAGTYLSTGQPANYGRFNPVQPNFNFNSSLSNVNVSSSNVVSSRGVNVSGNAADVSRDLTTSTRVLMGVHNNNNNNSSNGNNPSSNTGGNYGANGFTVLRSQNFSAAGSNGNPNDPDDLSVEPSTFIGNVVPSQAPFDPPRSFSGTGNRNQTFSNSPSPVFSDRQGPNNANSLSNRSGPSYTSPFNANNNNTKPNKDLINPFNNNNNINSSAGGSSADFKEAKPTTVPLFEKTDSPPSPLHAIEHTRKPTSKSSQDTHGQNSEDKNSKKKAKEDSPPSTPEERQIPTKSKPTSVAAPPKPQPKQPEPKYDDTFEDDNNNEGGESSSENTPVTHPINHKGAKGTGTQDRTPTDNTHTEMPSGENSPVNKKGNNHTSSKYSGYPREEEAPKKPASASPPPAPAADTNKKDKYNAYPTEDAPLTNPYVNQLDDLNNKNNESAKANAPTTASTPDFLKDHAGEKPPANHTTSVAQAYPKEAPAAPFAVKDDKDQRWLKEYEQRKRSFTSSGNLRRDAAQEQKKKNEAAITNDFDLPWMSSGVGMSEGDFGDEY